MISTLTPSLLDQLERRLKEATGADRDLDVAIYCALPADYHRHARPSNVRGKVVGYYRDGAHGTFGAEPYTASLDAALGLVERVLPGWGVDVGYPARLGEHNGLPWADVWPHRDDGFPGYRSRPTASHSNAPTPALAVCAALISALRSSLVTGEGA